MRAVVTALACSTLTLYWARHPGDAGLRLHAATGQQTPTIALLDRYDHGDREAVLRELARIGDARVVTRDLQKSAIAWTQVLGPGEAPRRRLVAATFALEAAALRFWPEEVDPLVELGCQLLRKNSNKDATEHAWFRASVAVFTRARDDGRLVIQAGPGAARGQRLPPAPRPMDHIAHALEEWPDEPRFKLAAAMAFAASADTEPARDLPWVRTEILSKDSQEGLRRARAAKAIRMFEELLGVPAVRAEASLRIGYLRLTLHDPEAAIRLFAVADDPDDLFISYLARFLAGRAYDRLGQRENANAMYRRALERVPRAQSASIALSANLYLAGRPDEAHKIAQDGLAEVSPSDDPWHEFGYGDRRLVPGLMATLRETTR